MRRRTLLKAGLAGGALLAAGGVAIVAGRDPRRDRVSVLSAVAPALLEGALPIDAGPRAAALARCVDGVGEAIDALAPSAQAELGQLFALLASTPGRVLMAGVTADWPRADPGQVADWLDRWRAHSFPLFRGAYSALHDLVLGTWYADESNWAGIGYGGPLAL